MKNKKVCIHNYHERCKAFQHGRLFAKPGRDSTDLNPSRSSVAGYCKWWGGECSHLTLKKEPSNG